LFIVSFSRFLDTLEKVTFTIVFEEGLGNVYMKGKVDREEISFIVLQISVC